MRRKCGRASVVLSPDRRRACERSFSSTLWACSRHHRTTGPVFGWLPWQPPPPRLLHVNKENIGVRADCRSLIRFADVFFFFSFSFFFSYIFHIINFNLNSVRKWWLSFSRGVFLFSRIVVVWSRRVVEIRRISGKRIFFFFFFCEMRNERKKDKKLCRMGDFYVMC